MEDSLWWTLVDAQFVISISTMVYYLWILMLMCNSKSIVFRSAFYRIFIVTGFFDVQAIAAIEWVRADLRLGLGPDYEIATRLMNTFTFSHFFIHVVGCFLMTLNRYMAICLPTFHEKWWTPQTVHVMLFVDIFLSFAVNTELFFIDIGYLWKNNRWITTGRSKPIPFIRITCSCIVIIYEFSSIILIAFTIHSIRKSRKKKKTQNFHRELGLVIAIAVECTLGGIECIYEITNIFELETTNNFILRWIQRDFSLFFFIVVSMNSYGIMFMSTDLRKEVVKFCHRIFKILRSCEDKKTTTCSVTSISTRSRCRN